MASLSKKVSTRWVKMQKVVQIRVNPDEVFMKLSHHRLDDPVKSPRDQGQAEGQILKNVHPAFDLKSQELVENPGHGDMKIGIFEVTGKPQRRSIIP